jgi:hypothetical protein
MWDPDAPAETPLVIKRENSAELGPTRLKKSASERSTKVERAVAQAFPACADQFGRAAPRHRPRPYLFTTS